MKTEVKIVRLALARIHQMDLAEPKPPASFVQHSNVYPEEKLVGVQLPPHGLPRGTFSRPVVVDPVRNHTELAERIAEARYWERYLGVKTPGAIEQIIQSWELDR